MTIHASSYSTRPFKHHRKKGRDKSILGFLAYYLFFLCVVVVGVLCYIWQPLQVVRMGYRIQTLAELRDNLKAENNVLKLEYSSLKYSGRIRRIARKKLKMGSPMGEQVVIVYNGVLRTD